MKPQKLQTLAAAAALVASAGAHAQSSVTIFGLLDVNYSHLSGSGNASQNILGTDGYQSSRLGFRGTEDLGGGMKAGFWLEAAVNPDNGTGGASNLNNQSAGGGASCTATTTTTTTTTTTATPAIPGTTLASTSTSTSTSACSFSANGSQGLTFARRSTVSLSSDWGELRLGRDYVPGFWNLSVFSPFGTNGVGSSGFLFYPVQGAARVTNVRASNSIGYFLPGNLGGFYGQAMYAFGENARTGAANQDDGKVTGLRVGYAAGALDVAVATTRTNIASLGNLTQTNIGASYDFGVAKPMFLWNENKVGATRTRTWLLGATAPVGPGLVRAAYTRVTTDRVANDANQWALGYVHNLSKRTALYANWSRVSNKNGGTNYNVGRATTVAGGSATGYELGVRHTF